MAARRLVEKSVSRTQCGAQYRTAEPGHETSLHSRVNQIAHQRARKIALSGSLRHEHREQILLRIDPEERPRNAAPEILADAAGERRDAGVPAHGEAETKAVAGGEQGAVGHNAGSEVIGGHQLQRLAADDPGAVERAAI